MLVKVSSGSLCRASKPVYAVLAVHVRSYATRIGSFPRALKVSLPTRRECHVYSQSLGRQAYF